MTENDPQYDSIGSKYDDYSKTATLKRAERYSFSRMVGNIEGKRILDLACGTGHYSRWLKEHGAKEVIGIDISPEMIRVANQHEENTPLGITYRVGDGLTFPQMGLFDLISAVWLFNNLKTKDEMLRMFRKAHDNLLDGSCLVIYTINPDFNLETSRFDKYGVRIKQETLEEGRYVQMGEFLTDPPVGVTVYRWSRQDYEWALQEAGFKDFTWKAPEVAPEDMIEYGEEYWQEFFDNNLGIGLICTK